MRLVRQALVIGGGLIALFLVLEHTTGFSQDVRSIATSGVGATKALQGR